MRNSARVDYGALKHERKEYGHRHEECQTGKIRQRIEVLYTIPPQAFACDLPGGIR
jgi:hypothetical protein